MSDCLFCKIVSGQVPAKIVHQDDQCIAFLDIAPQAPTHVLFVPRRHLASLNEATVEEKELLGHLMVTASKYARDNGIGETGYRQVVNCNRDAGQTVFHLHLHLLGGRPMGHFG
ncbi:MAG: histidine triad nucleotide-binding protein [Archangiaceae bacterium]|nr:histidine triad nucleotide-binding protein [Archangiaceae bacterium]